MGATANDSPRSSFFIVVVVIAFVCLLLLLLLHACGVVVVACLCFIVGFVYVWCEFLCLLSSIIT